MPREEFWQDKQWTGFVGGRTMRGLSLGGGGLGALLGNLSVYFGFQ